MKPLPDFQTWQERDEYFRNNAEYFTLFSMSGRGTSNKLEAKTLEEAIKLAQTKQVIAGNGWLIYGVIGPYSALVHTVPKKEG